MFNKNQSDSIFVPSLHETTKSMNSLSDEMIPLHGPISPLEAKFIKSLSRIDLKRNYTPMIHYESINYVLLDDEPEVESDRLLVTNGVNCNDKTSSCSLRRTCLMPKKRGFLSLCCLLFTPFAEFRYIIIIIIITQE